MKSIGNLLIAMSILLSLNACNAQINNSKTESVKIYGNCGMCETTIEKAGNVKKIAKVDWDESTQIATLTYDSEKTTRSEILKRIALAGYDNDEFLAPDDVYTSLHGCCQYDRVKKVESEEKSSAPEKHDVHMNHIEMESGKMEEKPKEKITEQVPQKLSDGGLKAVFTHYFEVKDALVATNKANTAAHAKELMSALNKVEMNQLSEEVHMVWMKTMKDLQIDAQNISSAKSIDKQRDAFQRLSSNMYKLIKVSDPESPVYYQHCPMANDGKGANWLSKENAIKNPYYGSQMMTCGKTVETLK